jgi:tRNA(Ile)-lysidine synthase
MEQRGKDWYVAVRLLKKTQGRDIVAYELFTRFGFSPEQIPHILKLLDTESGKSVSSGTHRVIRHRDFLVVTLAEPAQADIILVNEIPSIVRTQEGSFSFSWTEPGAMVTDDPFIALLDAQDIRLPMLLRTRREGDYFYPLGMGGKKKKLKRLLIDLKVPVHEKDRIRILECDKKILWVAGKRIDERYKLRPSTKRILKVVFVPTS